LIHRLVVGHFDLSADRRLVSTRPLDLNLVRQLLLAAGATEAPDGELMIGEEAVHVLDGYVSLPWLSGRHNQAAERAGLELARELGTVLAEERIPGLWGPRGHVFYPPEVATDQL
jgi:hypothetical protein